MVSNVSPKNSLGALDLIRITFVISLRVLFFHLAPLDSDKYGGVVS